MARHPSDEAFSEFVHGAWPGLYRTAYLLLGDRGLAEDLVQTALAKTYAAWPSVRDVQAAPGYARTTLVNTAASWFRKRSLAQRAADGALPEGASHDADPRTGPPCSTPSSTCRRASGPWSCCASTRTCPSPRPPARSACSDGTVKSQTSNALDTLRGLLGDAVIPLDHGSHP